MEAADRDACQTSGVVVKLQKMDVGIVVLVVEAQLLVGVDQGEATGMQTAGIERTVVEEWGSVVM
jgi:hypothetical protein